MGRKEKSSNSAAHRRTDIALSTAGAMLPRPERGNAVADFFRYHGAWAPGVRLFRAIGFRAKAIIIATTFVLPIGLLGWNYFGNQAGQIAFSAKERDGVTYSRAVMALLEPLQQQRLYSLQEATLGAAPPELAAARSAAEAGLANLQKHEREFGVGLGTGDSMKKLLDAAAALPTGSAGADAVFAAHTARVGALLDLLGVAGDGSNLTLDPDIDTYYLMDAAVFRLPAMIEAAAQMRGLGAALLTGGKATPAQLRRILEQQVILKTHLAALDAGVAKAVAYNKSVADTLKADAAKARVAVLVEQTEATLLRDEGIQGDAKALVAAGDAAVTAMLELAARATDTLDGLLAARVERMEAGQRLVAVVLALGLASALYLFLCFRKVLEGGLKEVAFHINAMRDGNLTTSPHAWGGDEAASLMHTLQSMQAALRGIVTQVRRASDSMVTASAQIAGGAADLSVRTEQSASKLEQTASAMEQIAATVKNGEATIVEATHLADSNAESAERGGAVVVELVETMRQIQHSSDRIGEIIGVIDGIAFQTNILALNAAVEAARAGEQGRGFAVVASEVRALAQRSAAAAKEIKSLIVESGERVESGTRIVKDAGDVMGEIVGKASRVRELLTEAAAGSREQTTGVAQTAKAVQDMDDATQQNAALVEQTAAAASSLKEQANELAQGVAAFHLP